MRSEEELNRIYGKPSNRRHAKPLEWRVRRGAEAYAAGEMSLQDILTTYRINTRDLYDRLNRDEIPRRRPGKKIDSPPGE